MRFFGLFGESIDYYKPLGEWFKCKPHAPGNLHCSFEKRKLFYLNAKDVYANYIVNALICILSNSDVLFCLSLGKYQLDAMYGHFNELVNSAWSQHVDNPIKRQ